MSAKSQIHCMAVSIDIKKVSMSIRFPCSLSFQLKSETNTVDSKKIYELKNNECQVNELLRLEIEGEFNLMKMKYQEKKVTLNAFMISNTGKIAAGSLTINPFSKEINSLHQMAHYLEKCPDRQAKIYLTQSCHLLQRKEKERLDKTIINDLKIHLNSQTDYGFQKNIHRKTQPSEPYYQQTFNKSFQENNKFKIIGEQMTPKNKRNFQIELNEFPMNQSEVEEVIPVSKSERQLHRQAIQIKTNGGNTSIRNKKQFEIDRINRSKSKSHNKYHPAEGKIKIEENFKSMRSQYQNIKQKNYVSELEEEMAKLNQKIKNYQRKQANLSSNLREVREELDKKKSKSQQLEKQKVELEEIVEEKDQKVKRLQKELKESAETYQEVMTQFKSAKHQFEIKQHSMKEQLKKIEVKLKQSEDEKSLINQELHKNVKVIEENQRKYQSALKEKQKIQLDEKTKLHKKIEQLAQSLEKQEHEHKGLIELQDQLEAENKRQGQLLFEKEAKIENNQNQINTINSHLKKEIECRKRLEAEVEILQESELERQSLKKKWMEICISLKNQSEKNQKLEKQILGLEDNLKSTEEQLQKKQYQQNQMQTKMVKLKKEIQQAKHQFELKAREADTFNLYNTNANQKIVQLKQKLDIEKTTIEDIQKQFEIKLAYFQKAKSSYEAQTDDLKWQISKGQSALEQLAYQMKISNEQTYKLSEDNLQKGQRIKRLEQEVLALSLSNETSSNTIKEHEAHKKRLLSEIKEKQQEFQEAKKKNQQLLEELHSSQQKSKGLESSIKEKINFDDRKIKEKDQTLQQKQEILNSAHTQIALKQEENSELKQKIYMLNNEIQYIKETSSSHKKENERLEQLIKKNKIVEEELRSEVIGLEEEKRKKSDEVLELQKMVEKAQKQSTIYRSQNLAAFVALYQALIRSDEVNLNSQLELLHFPDQKLSKLQIEIVQHRNQLLQKHSTLLIQANTEKDSANQELFKLRQLHEAHLIQIENQNSIHQKQIKSLQIQIAEAQTLLEETQIASKSLQHQKIIEIQELKKLSQKDQQQLQELTFQIHSLIAQNQATKSESYEQEQKAIKAKIQCMKEKHLLESRLTESQQNISVKIIQFESTISQLDIKRSNMEKEVLECSELLKKKDFQINQLLGEIQRKDTEIQAFSEQNFETKEMLRRAERQGKEREKQLKTIIKELEEKREQHSHERIRHEQLQYKSQQQSTIIYEMQLEMEKSKEENKMQQDKLNLELQNLKPKMEILRMQVEKLQQDIKLSKEREISLVAELDLKGFNFNQLHSNMQDRIIQIEDLKGENSRNKHSNQLLKAEFEDLKNKLLKNQEIIANYQHQQQILENHLKKTKHQLSLLQASSEDQLKARLQMQRVKTEVKQIKEEKEQMENNYEKVINSMKWTVKQSKKDETNKINREEQFKRKIKQLEKLLQEENWDLASTRKKIINEAERDKKQLLEKMRILEEENDKLSESLEAMRFASQKSEKAYLEACKEFREELQAKDFIIQNQSQELDNCQHEITTQLYLQNQTKNKLAKEVEKAKKFATDVEKQKQIGAQKSKKTKEDFRKKMSDTVNRKLKELKVQKWKNSMSQSELMSLVSKMESIVVDAVREFN